MKRQQQSPKCKCDEPLTQQSQAEAQGVHKSYNLCNEYRAKELLTVIKVLDILKKCKLCADYDLYCKPDREKEALKVIIESQLRRTTEQKLFPFMISEQAALAQEDEMISNLLMLP